MYSVDCQQVMMKREIFIRIGFDGGSVYINQNIELLLAMHFRGALIRTIPILGRLSWTYDFNSNLIAIFNITTECFY